MIKIKNLTKIYNNVCNSTKTVALQNVTFSVQNGEFIGIVGRSGSGKSTLLNLMAAIDAPTEGQILYDGLDIANYSEDERARFRNENTGFVFQSFYLEANFTVLENIVIPLIIRGVEKRIREAEGRELLNEFGLAEKENSFPKELSGGEMQRVSLCRALINKPKYIFADEPTGNLDKKSGDQIIEKFKEIKAKGISVIMVTHNLEYAKECDRTITLSDGEIL